MPSARIVEAIDVLEDGQFCISACVPWPPPDQLCLDGFEERLKSRIILAIALVAHRHLKAVLAQDLLVIAETVLRSAIRVMNAAFAPFLNRMLAAVRRAFR